MKSISIDTTVSLLVVACVFLISGFAIFSEAQTAIPGIGFGGAIITQPLAPCVPAPIPGAIAGIPFIVGPPKGGPTIYVPGLSQTFSYGPPAHVGQQLLGKPAPLPGGCFIIVPCPTPTGTCYAPHLMVPTGLPILFHGASV